MRKKKNAIAKRAHDTWMIEAADELFTARDLLAVLDLAVTSPHDDEPFERSERQGLWRVISDAQRRIVAVADELAKRAKAR